MFFGPSLLERAYLLLVAIDFRQIGALGMESVVVRISSVEEDWWTLIGIDWHFHWVSQLPSWVETRWIQLTTWFLRMAKQTSINIWSTIVNPSLAVLIAPEYII